MANNVNGEYSWLADSQRTCVSLIRHKSGLVIARDSRVPIVRFARETALWSMRVIIREWYALGMVHGEGTSGRSPSIGYLVSSS